MAVDKYDAAVYDGTYSCETGNEGETRTMKALELKIPPVAVVLIVGAIWFSRLALQEFLLLDRLVNVYTNDAQVKMDAFAIKPKVTAEVLEVLVKEGERVQKGQVLMRLAQLNL